MKEFVIQWFVISRLHSSVEKQQLNDSNLYIGVSITEYYSAIHRSVQYFLRLSFLNKKQFLPSKSKYLSKNKISIKITLFIDLC